MFSNKFTIIIFMVYAIFKYNTKFVLYTAVSLIVFTNDCCIFFVTNLQALNGRGSDDSAVDVELFDKENLVEVLLHQGTCRV